MNTHVDPLKTFPEKTVTPPEATEDTKKILEDTAEKLHALQDVLRVRMHLAGMEARDLRHEVLDSVTELSRKLHGFAFQLDQQMDQSGLQLRLGLMEAKQRWDMTLKETQDLLEVMRKDKNKAMEYMGGLRLQTKLAKLEARDFLQTAEQDLRKGARVFGRQVAEVAHQLNASVSNFLKHLS